MTNIDKNSIKQFIKKWTNRGYEKGEGQVYWISLLNEVLGVKNPQDYLVFEDRVKLDHTSFIDARIPSTNVLIEQKSINKNLTDAIKQSDGSLLSPYQQAKRYSAELPYSERPRWIVLSNFKEIHVYDMEKPNGTPEIIYLKDLEKDYYRLQFLIDKKDEHIEKELEISLKAGEIVGKLYNALLREYQNPQDEETLHHLNQLCVRLVFCFYAEDAELFGKHNKFYDYLNKYRDNINSFRNALIDIFKILNQKENERDPYLDEELLSFPYVNGGLFENSDLVIPRMNEEIIAIILDKASANFDWSSISPTIFGGVFESTLNPETRRTGGMHYTSIENIHKVINPLFMNALNEEFEKCLQIKYEKTRNKALRSLQDKMANFKYLDPACGSGNFLTESYIQLRKLENKILKEIYSEQIFMGQTDYPIKVSINQFYGIEINDFATTVATTALWIAEAQMFKKTEEILHMNVEFFPLKSYANIVQANALTTDWEEIISKDELDFIMGNPPFVGGMMMNKIQKEEIKSIFGNIRNIGEIDYVCSWYKKAAELMVENTNIKTAFVSTNSISQGLQPGIYWKYLVENYNTEIDFAYKTFKWESEASDKAAVHVVIIGFSNKLKINKNKILFDNGKIKIVNYINGYLADAPEVFIESRKIQLHDVSEMVFGNMPRDCGGFILTQEEKNEFIKKEPLSEKWIREYIGAREFINRIPRYCLWLVEASPAELRKCPIIMERIKSVKEFRENSKAASTRKMAETPTLFAQITQPEGVPYVIVPRVSSENRRYVPMGFLNGDVISSDAVLIVPNANLYEFAILTSNVHMSWMRAVAGRLEMRYRYSKEIVYNNFPWPSPTEKQKEKIEKTAQMILNARDMYPDSSLADLYDDTLMPVELRKAHQENDKAVMEAYGFDWRNMTEAECVAELMKMYQRKIKE